MRLKGAALALACGALLAFGLSAVAQEAAPTPRVPSAPAWLVFTRRPAPPAAEIIFVDKFSGQETRTAVTGERFTPAGDSVLYFDPNLNRVMQAFPDGVLREHPFIQPAPDTRRVDWLVSPDGRQIAWTLTSAAPGGLVTTTYIAALDGGDQRAVLTDGPRDGIRALPVAFSADQTTLYLDFQPDGIADFTPFPQYAGLIALNLATGVWERLPGEPGCFCGAGFGAGLLVRLAVSPDLGGFDVRVVNLAGAEAVIQTIPAVPRRNFTQAGGVVISPDDTRAVYALAQVRGFGTPEQSIQTVFMLVDLQILRQAPLTAPITTFVEPLAWTEDNSAVLLTSRQRDGTWKINLADGQLVKVAEATYLGTLPQPS